jgi:hypothetical protein
MPLDWLPNTASQLDRALRAYFVGATATTHEQTMIANDHRRRSLPLLDIATAFGDRNRAVPSPLYSGSFDYPVDITAEFPANPEAGHPNPDLYSLEMDRFIGQITWLMDLRDPDQGYPLVCAAITTAGRALKTVGSTKSKAANTDMGEFTVQFIVPAAEQRVKVSDDGVFWLERRSYIITACSNAL